jgi:hypothetical protein
VAKSFGARYVVARRHSAWDHSMPTLLIENSVRQLARADSRNDGLWVAIGDLEAATGWVLKPEGACRGDVCVPIPRGRESEFVLGGHFNATAFAGYLEQPVVHEGDAWAVGEAAGARTSALRSLEAPDFTLPDMDGREHTLSDYRGRKVFLVSWASW